MTEFDELSRFDLALNWVCDRIGRLYESNPVGRTFIALWDTFVYGDFSKFHEIRRRRNP